VVITRAGSAFIQDGVNTFIFELGAAMLKRGINVHILTGFCPKGVENPRDRARYLFDVEDVPPILFLKRGVFRNSLEKVLCWTVKGARVLSKIKPDGTILNGVIPCCPVGTRITVCHGLKTHGVYPRTLKYYNYLMYRAFGPLVAVSEGLKRDIASELKLKDVRVIPVGLDAEKYSPLPLEERKSAILHVGTRPVKNLPTTLKAFKIISERIPDAKLYIAGLRPTYKCVDEDTKGKVFFLGPVPRKELRSLYAKVLLVSVPSYYEAFSYATLEAFACGTPVIGSEANPSELLIEGFNGHRIPRPEDHVALGERSIELILNTSKWKRMSANARATAIEYDVERTVDSYLDMIVRERKINKGSHVGR
jgi:glycosyltransferase involved in cell wall biosynthesis